jgi:hypothetical protein
VLQLAIEQLDDYKELLGYTVGVNGFSKELLLTLLLYRGY